MEGFLTLAGQLFFILCIQSVLEVLAARRPNDPLLKPVELGCYLASLVMVVRFMEGYLGDVFQMLLKFF